MVKTVKNVPEVDEDLAKMVDQMWANKIAGVKASAQPELLKWKSCFILNLEILKETGQLDNVRAALNHFNSRLITPNPVGTGYELRIINGWWKNPYK